MDKDSQNTQGTLLIWCDIGTDLGDLRCTFAKQGWTVDAIASKGELLHNLEHHSPMCLIICDDPERTRLEVVLNNDVTSSLDDVPVIAAVRQGDVPRSVKAMQSGAVTVLELRAGECIPKTSSLIQAIDEHVRPAQDWRNIDPRDLIVRAPDSPLLGVLEVLPQIARSDAPVLILGESGTGKDLFAKVIHELGEQRDTESRPMISINCGAIPENLLESELFGHVKGSFTGAHEDQLGLLQAADGGTLFLDEIAEMPMHLQVKLLRVLQDGMVTPIGSREPTKVNFRIIAATHTNLEEAIKLGTFREDLFYRLNVLPIELPALRDHPQDIIPLGDFFIQKHNVNHNTNIVGITHETRSLLKRYQWPGNIRELEHLLERVCVMKQSGFIERDDLPESVLNAPPVVHFGLDVPSEGIDMTDTLDRLERTLLESAIKKADGNKAQAARLLGINRTTLVEKLKRKNIS